MKYVFVDSNFLIQYKDPVAIDFETAFGPFDKLYLILSDPVIREMDKFKNEGNTRRAKKARKINSILKQFTSTLAVLELSEKVFLKLCLGYRNDDLAELGYNLDLGMSDDRIIAHILRFKEDNPTAEVYFMSNDTIPKLRAIEHEVDVIDIPDEWLLAPEPDEKDKMIQKLSDMNKELLSKHPVIDIDYLVNGEKSIKKTRGCSASISIDYYPTLSNEQVEELVNQVTELYPIKMDYSDEIKKRDDQNAINDLKTLMRYGAIKYEIPNEKSIREYQEDKYPAWLDNVSEWIKTTPQDIQVPLSLIKMQVYLSNSGCVVGEKVVVDVQLLDGCLYTPSKIAESLIKKEIRNFPKPPDPPKGHYKNYSGIPPYVCPPNPYYQIPSMTQIPISNFKHMILTKPSEFIIEEESDDFQNHIIYKCTELKHKIKTDPIQFYVFTPIQEEKFCIKLICTVSANNLPSPIISNFEISIAPNVCDTMKMLKKTIGIA